MKDRHPEKDTQQPCGLPAETFPFLRGVWSTRRCCASYNLVFRVEQSPIFGGRPATFSFINFNRTALQCRSAVFSLAHHGAEYSFGQFWAFWAF